MLYALYGADRLAVRRHRDALVREFAPDGLDDIACARLDGSRCAPDELSVACNALTFFGGRRVVVVDDLLTRFEAPRRGRAGGDARPEEGGPVDDSGGEEPAAEAEPVPAEPPAGGRRGKLTGLAGRFAAVLNAVPDETVLILWERDTVRATNPLLQIVRRRGEAEEHPLPHGLMLEKWIEDQARSLGVGLEPGLPQLLGTYIGDEPEVLAEELDKLATYAGPGGTITAETLRLLTPQLSQAVAFDLIQAMGQRRGAVALSLLRRLLQHGEKTYSIVGLLGWQVRSLLQVQALGRERLTPAAIAARLGMKEFAVRKTQESLRHYTAEGLRRLHRCLLAVDEEIKTSSSDGEASLELLVLEMSRPEGAAARR